MAPVKTRLIPSRSFFWALPHHEAKSNIGRKLSWEKGEKIQFECSVKRRVQTPYAKCPFIDPVAPRNHSAPAPFALPLRHSPSSHCTLASHSTAHAYEIYKTTRTSAKIWRRIFEGCMRMRKKSAAIGLPSRESWICALLFHHDDTTLTLRLYASPDRETIKL